MLEITEIAIVAGHKQHGACGPYMLLAGYAALEQKPEQSRGRALLD